jgi:hypothetical protein
MQGREHIIALGEDRVEQFDKLVSSGKTEEEAAAAIISGMLAILNQDLIKFKRKAGISLNGNSEELRKIKEYAGKI